MSNLSTFTKDKSQTSWRQFSAQSWETKQLFGFYWSSVADSMPNVAFEEA